MPALTRRTLLATTATALALPATAMTPDPRRATQMAEAATRFLATGPDGARFPLSGAEPTRWHWTNIRRFPRAGARLGFMTTAQRSAAMDLMEASLSAEGADRARRIMALEALINRDPEDYFWSVFETPGDGTWGWRLEGHHLSHHWRVAEARVSAMPFFLGAWPNRGADGTRPLGAIEDMARDLVAGLPDEARRIARVAPEARPGHVTGNAPVAREPALQGLRLAEAGAAQSGRALAALYLASLPQEEANAALVRLDAAGADNLYLSWRGPLDVDRPVYWRLQGPTFVLEWDDTLNAGDHVHSVWRDYQTDFGTAA